MKLGIYIGLFVIIFFSLITVLPSYSQSSSQSENCPQGTRPEVRGTEIVCVKISNVQKTCPDGTYQGLDNQGNFACRDSVTNQIVDPNTGLMTDSQTGEIILEDDQMMYVGIGIAVLILIIIIAGVSRKKSYKELPRKGFSDSVKEEVLRAQNHRCAKCNRVLDVVDFDHINADKTNNDISNCQALCPNCHARKSRKEQSKFNNED